MRPNIRRSCSHGISNIRRNYIVSDNPEHAKRFCCLKSRIVDNGYQPLHQPLARSIEELLPVRVSTSPWCFILLRTSLVVSSVCAAFLLPFFGLVMALIGSLLSILVAVIMPALCFLKIVGKKATTVQIVSSIAIVALGVISAILGTYSSLFEIANSY